jgi:uncharacterized protein
LDAVIPAQNTRLIRVFEERR